MKAKRTITASAVASVAAVALTWWHRHSQHVCAREAQFDSKCMQEALDTFEGEGGLVRS
jgi:hypothetical protein